MKTEHNEFIKLTEAGEGVTYRQRRGYAQWKIQRETLKESNKICSYCNLTGHRVLTCPDRLGHVEILRKVNKWWKPIVEETLIETGLGLGCLLSLPRGSYATDEETHIPFLVTGIQKYGLDFTCIRERFGNIEIMNTTNMKRSYSRVPDEFLRALYNRAFSVEGTVWTEYRSSYNTTNPFQSWIAKPYFLFREDKEVISSADRTFSTTIHFPLDEKRDINKMFRSGKGEYYTKESTGEWLKEMYILLQTYKGLK
jgi:hypothetical protein